MNVVIEGSSDSKTLTVTVTSDKAMTNSQALAALMYAAEEFARSVKENIKDTNNGKGGH